MVAITKLNSKTFAIPILTAFAYKIFKIDRIALRI